METIEIELEDGTRIEVSKDFLDASEDEQAAFLQEVMQAQRDDSSVGERATGGDGETRNPLRAALGSAGKVAGNVASALDFGIDAASVAISPSVYRGMVSKEGREHDRQVAQAMMDDPSLNRQQAIEKLGLAPHPSVAAAGKIAERPNIFQSFEEVTEDYSRSMGRYVPGMTMKEIREAAASGKPLRALGGAAEMAAGGAIAGAPEAAMFLTGPTAAVQLAGQIEDGSQARAANQGREDVRLTDVLATAPAEAANAAMSRFGLRASGPAAVLARETGTGVAQGSLSDASQTIGTEEGFDLERNIDRGLEGGLAGLGGSGTRIAGARGKDAIDNRFLGLRLKDLENPERLRVLNIERKAVGDIVQRLEEARAMGQDVTMAHNGTHAARTLAEEAANDFQTVVESLKKVGAVPRGRLADEDGLPSPVRTHFDLLQQGGKNAKNSQRIILREQMEAIDSLDAPESVKQTLRDQIDYIQSLSNAGIKARQVSGPVASTMESLAGIAGHGVGFELGKPAGKTGSFSTAVAAQRGLSNVARQVGSNVDRFFGNTEPDIVRKAGMIDRALNKRGVAESTLNVSKDLADVMSLSEKGREFVNETELEAMAQFPDTVGQFGSPRLKTMQKEREITAGETLAAINDLHNEGVLTPAMVRELLTTGGDKMDYELFGLIESQIAVKAEESRRGVKTDLVSKMGAAAQQREDRFDQWRKTRDQ